VEPETGASAQELICNLNNSNGLFVDQLVVTNCAVGMLEKAKEKLSTTAVTAAMGGEGVENAITIIVEREQFQSITVHKCYL
jgi:hypothetical protein